VSTGGGENERRDSNDATADDDMPPPNLFTADVVESKVNSSNRRRELGVVMRVGWLSDDEYTDEFDDVDFEEHEVLVNWMDSGVGVQDPDSIVAVDRVLMFGDNIERANAPRGVGPYATVIGVRVTATIEALEERADGSPLFRRRGVDVFAELAKPYAVDARSLVVYRCFMGVVRSVVFDMDVSAAGMTVTLTDVSVDALEMTYEGESDMAPFSALADIELGSNIVLNTEMALTFIGDAQRQQLRRFLSSREEFVTVRVDAIRPHDAIVQWVGAPAGRFGSMSDESADLPSERMRLADLTALDPVVDSASYMFNCVARVASTGRMCNIVDTRSVIDLRWQDGTVERDLPAIDFIPIAHVLDQDLFPGDFVVSEAVSDGDANNLSHSSHADGESPAAAATATSANVDALDRTLDLLLVAPGATGSSSDAAAAADPLAARTNLLRRKGVIVTVSHAKQTCDVLWLREPSGVAVDGRPADTVLERDVSALSLKPHNDLDDLRLSDIVTLMPGHPLLAATPPPPFVGCLIDVNLTNGRLVVRWTDGSTSEVDSQDVQRIDPGPFLSMVDDDDDDDDEFDDDEDDELNSEEDDSVAAPPQHIAEPLLAMLMGDEQPSGPHAANVRRQFDSVVRDLSRGPEMALRAVTKLFCGAARFTPLFLAPDAPLVPFPSSHEAFLAALRGQQLPAVTLLVLSLTGNSDTAPFYEACRVHVAEALAAPRDAPPAVAAPAIAAAPTTSDGATAAAPAAAVDDTVSEHFFVSSGTPPAPSATLVSFDLQALDVQPTAAHGSSHQYADKDVEFRTAQRAMHEWQVLQGGLPTHGIGVRAYEERLDLLKLLVVGPAGSPYEDVPFFFDLRFGGDYPNSAPEVHFLSFVGQKLHPNLNVDGNVCLSLLGTWSGAESESWQGADSTVLQLVLSLHGLVLGDAEPYFLEAGYERQRGTAEGQRHSKRYTERALLLVVRHLIHVVARCVQDVHFERMLAARGVAPDADDAGDGGVFGFRQMLRAHFAARGDALVARFVGYTAESSVYSPGCRSALVPLVARLQRVMDALKTLLVRPSASTQ
jgi:ubiquitin-protein ligase